MAHRVFHKSRCQKVQQVHTKGREIPIMVFHCQSIWSIYYIFFFILGLESHKTHFRLSSLAQESESLFCFFLFLLVLFHSSWEQLNGFCFSNNTTEADALNNDLALFCLHIDLKSIKCDIFYKTEISFSRFFFPFFFSRRKFWSEENYFSVFLFLFFQEQTFFFSSFLVFLHSLSRDFPVHALHTFLPRKIKTKKKGATKWSCGIFSNLPRMR